ncbi:MAG: efflux RND transporter periplasmic adaptor subunit [Candidatus Eremiobacterota bacterium]
MKKYRNVIIIIILIIIGLCAFSKYNSMQKQKEAIKNWKTVKVKKDTMEVIVNTTGTIKASTQIDIKSEISGKIIKLPYKRGERISKGTIIAIIDDQQQKQSYLQSDAAYKSSIALLEKSELDRNYTADNNGVTIETKRIALEKANLTYNQSIQQIEEAKKLGQAQIEQYKTALEQQQKNLDKTLAGSRKQDIAQKLATVQSREADMNYKSIQFERQKTLYEKYYVAKKDVDSAENDYLQAKAAYESAKEDYDKTVEGSWEEDIAIARVQVEKAKKDLQTQIDQTKNNIADKERTVDTAMKDLKAAEANLQLEIVNSQQVGMKAADIKNSEANLSKAEAQRKQDFDNLSKTKIPSPVNGIIINRPVNVGDVVASQVSTAGGTVLMTIADLGEIYAEANIDEADVGKIRKNQTVTIHAAAYKQINIKGLITDVAPQAVQVQQIPTFNTKIKVLLDKIAEKELPSGKTRYELLYPGMSVDADIYVDTRSDVLQIPVQAVWKKDAKNYVTLISDNKTLRDVEVTTGISDDVMIEILTGVSEGNEIKLPD